MQNIITSTRIKMLLVIVFTFFAVKLVAPNLFIANSPEVNKVFISDMVSTPGRIIAMPGQFIASLGNFRFNLFNNSSQENITVGPETMADVKEVSPPADAVFKYISTGVSAAEDTATGEKYIKVEAGTKYRIVGQIVINGKTYPKIEFIK